MATGREAEAMLASFTGILPVRVSTTTRALREAIKANGAPADLWLRTGRGYRDGSVLPHHVLNAALGLLVQPSEAAELVVALRNLERTSGRKRLRGRENLLSDVVHYTEGPDHTFGKQPSPSDLTLGFLMDAALYAYCGRSRAGGEALTADLLKSLRLIRIRLGHSMSAEAIWTGSNGGYEISDIFTAPTVTLPGLTLPVQDNSLFDRIVEISSDQFRRMAEIVGAETNQPTLISDAGAAGPENETAAPGPGKDTSTAVAKDQPAGTELGTLQSHSTVEREKIQPSSKTQAGRFHHSHRSDTHD